MKIDTHQHYWIYDSQEYSWINDDMPALQSHLLPKDIENTLIKYEIDGVIAVQARQTTEENSFLLRLANHYSWIEGVIGWVDIRANTLSEDLEMYKNTKMKGFRHLIQDEKSPPHFFIDKKFNLGIRKLLEAGFIYELLFHEEHLYEATSFCQRHDDCPLIIDHLGKPDIYGTDFKEWRNKIQKLARLPHVYCKLSGLITEAGENWNKADIYPFIETAIEFFTPERLMFGSDWPVCQLIGDYDSVYKLIVNSIQSLTVNEQEMIMGKNACNIYKIIK